MKQPRVGDIVYLNSGSPQLTVTSVESPNDDPTVYVTWMADDVAHTVHKANFPASCLRETRP